MYADELVLPWLQALLEALPPVELFDAHTHLGCDDPDGSCCEPSELLAALDLVQGRAVTFPLKEPGGYRAANEQVIAAAEASDGRLVAFCRIDPWQDPVAELERSLAAGARGVKLHPRAERFDLRHPGVAAVLAVAAERRLPVVIHSGLGIPSLGPDALTLSARYPGARLVLAHLGVTELSWIGRALPDHPDLFFDTAWWSPADHLALFSHVPPGRILLGSDTPYGTPAAAAIVAIRCALHAGLSPEQAASVAGRQLGRLLSGDEPIDLGPAPARDFARPALLDRVFSLLVAALSRMLEGRPASGLLELARLGCEVDDGLQEAEVLAQIGELLDRWRGYSQGRTNDALRSAGFHVVLVAGALAAAPTAPLPRLDRRAANVKR